MTQQDDQRLSRLTLWAFVAGVLGLVLCFVLGWAVDAPFYYAYLAAFILWLGLPLGGAMIVMMHHLTGGKWGWSIRLLCEAAMATLPLAAILFTPIAIGLPQIYRWARMVHPVDEHLKRKLLYLNEPFFLGRVALMFILWGLIIWPLYRWSRREDVEGASDQLATRLQRLSGYGLGVFTLSISVTSVDWIESLNVDWYSSILGIYLIVALALTATALIALIAAIISLRPDSDVGMTPHMLYDLGNILLAMIIFHAYIAFVQYFIIWNGNTKATVSWMMPRTHGVWMYVAFLIMGLHFFIPLFALFFRNVKRTPRMLMMVCIVILVACMVDNTWLVLPSAPDVYWPTAFVMIGAIVGVGGLMLSAFFWQWRRLAPAAYEERGVAA